jgi:hypothetical protein
MHLEQTAEEKRHPEHGPAPVGVDPVYGESGGEAVIEIPEDAYKQNYVYHQSRRILGG